LFLISTGKEKADVNYFNASSVSTMEKDCRQDMEIKVGQLNFLRFSVVLMAMKVVKETPVTALSH
jgi:hypothetical protein